MNEPLFVLANRRAEPPFDRLPAEVVRTTDEARTALRVHRRARWIAPRSSLLRPLVTAIGAGTSAHGLLVLARTSPSRRELLDASFGAVIALADGIRLAPVHELVEVLASANAADLFIGGTVDRDDGVVVLYRGSFERLVVPLAWFKRSRGAPAMELAEFAITDFGHTVRFGPYEAAADAILYEFDRDARHRMRQRRLSEDRSFGACLRRLRLQRGLSRREFSGLSEKTIARMERGEVERPHRRTLARIARRLGVGPDEITSF